MLRYRVSVSVGANQNAGVAHNGSRRADSGTKHLNCDIKHLRNPLPLLAWSTNYRTKEPVRARRLKVISNGIRFDF